MYVEERYFAPTDGETRASMIFVHIDGGAETFTAAEFTPLANVLADEAKAKRMAREQMVKEIMRQIQERLFGA
jgi:hypothetical protein